jgi:hypothetical protein
VAIESASLADSAAAKPATKRLLLGVLTKHARHDQGMQRILVCTRPVSLDRTDVGVRGSAFLDFEARALTSSKRLQAPNLRADLHLRLSRRIIGWPTSRLARSRCPDYCRRGRRTSVGLRAPTASPMTTGPGPAAGAWTRPSDSPRGARRPCRLPLAGDGTFSESRASEWTQAELHGVVPDLDMEEPT